MRVSVAMRSVGAAVLIGLSASFAQAGQRAFITRTRLLIRYMFGKDVSGFSVGLAVSF